MKTELFITAYKCGIKQFKQHFNGCTIVKTNAITRKIISEMYPELKGYGVYVDTYASVGPYCNEGYGDITHTNVVLDLQKVNLAIKKHNKNEENKKNSKES